MQGVFLDLIMNQVEQAQKDLSLFANTQFTGDSPRYPLFNKLNGILALKQGKYEQAARYLQIAFDASLADPINASVLGNYLIATLIPQSKFEEALSITNQILQANSGSIMTMLNRSFILGSLDQSHESQKQLERAARIAPTDFRVFSQLTQNASLDR
jgi:tetratricopeptide (TPR) repeat protein